MVSRWPSPLEVRFAGQVVQQILHGCHCEVVICIVYIFDPHQHFNNKQSLTLDLSQGLVFQNMLIMHKCRDLIGCWEVDLKSF